MILYRKSPFWTPFQLQKFELRKKKPSANVFWVFRIQNNFVELNPSDPKKLASGFFFLNSNFWSWKGVQNGLFLYRITFLPCSYEAKVKNKNFFFPREEKFLFSLFHRRQKKSERGRKVIPCIENLFFWNIFGVCGLTPDFYT